MLSRSVVSDSLRPHGLRHARFLCPWGFSRQEYWSGLPCPAPGDFPNPGMEPRSLAFQVDSLPTEPPGYPRLTVHLRVSHKLFGAMGRGTNGVRKHFPGRNKALQSVSGKTRKKGSGGGFECSGQRRSTCQGPEVAPPFVSPGAPLERGPHCVHRSVFLQNRQLGRLRQEDALCVPGSPAFGTVADAQ